jgi:hypothetical protein
MSTWTEPKTDWVATDYFNLSDYTRITGNLNYIHDLASSFYKTGYDKGAWESPYSVSKGSAFSYMAARRIENDVINMADATFWVSDYEELKHHAGLKSMAWTYEDLNIIERDMKRLKEMLEAQKANRAHLALELGGVQFG